MVIQISVNFLMHLFGYEKNNLIIFIFFYFFVSENKLDSALTKINILSSEEDKELIKESGHIHSDVIGDFSSLNDSSGQVINIFL